MELNHEQSAAFEAIQSGKNVFLTGPAGSGKSFLIRKVVDWAEAQRKTIAITALTGCAALLLGSRAKTLHSWAGIGWGREPVAELCNTINKIPKVKRRWRVTDLLIVDEISMIQPDLLEKLDAIGKLLRKKTAPFGGIQLILCGDYFQLPPVTRGISGESLAAGRFAFEAPIWKSLQLVPVLLSKIERQTDAGFQKLLNECRIGAPSKESIELLRSRQGLDWKTQLIRPTLLFSRNADVDTINEKNIAALKQPLHIYDAKTVIVDVEDEVVPRGDHRERLEQKLDNDANYSAHLELCKGCQVMLLVNKDMEAGLVNGSRGVVIGFREVDDAPIVQFLHGDPIPIERHEWQSNESKVLRRSQIPLRVAYAITIHKSQGATLDCALVDIGSTTFEFGQAYVALSRVRDLDSLYVWNLDPSKIRAHPSVVKFYMELMDAPAAPQAPVVHTSVPLLCEDLDASWQKIVKPWCETELGRECLVRVAERQAATTVYPEQGQILEALKHAPVDSVKVILLGQDPYYRPGQAHGLSFSVRPGVVLPPSLRNIRKELLDDLNLPESAWPASQGTLTHWARQGVLLLNAILTVEEGKPTSHAGYGWEDLTTRILGSVVQAHMDKPLVFLAWGQYAQNIVGRLRLGEKHAIVSSVHPSPLSAYAGFFGSKPFSRVNAELEKYGLAPIDWAFHAAADSEDPMGV